MSRTKTRVSADRSPKKKSEKARNYSNGMKRTQKKGKKAQKSEEGV